MEWELFLGACFLTAAMLLPHVTAKPVVAGMALAAVIRWTSTLVNRRRK